MGSVLIKHEPEFDLVRPTSSGYLPVSQGTAISVAYVQLKQGMSDYAALIRPTMFAPFRLLPARQEQYRAIGDRVAGCSFRCMRSSQRTRVLHR